MRAEINRRSMLKIAGTAAGAATVAAAVPAAPASVPTRLRHPGLHPRPFHQAGGRTLTAPSASASTASGSGSAAGATSATPSPSPKPQGDRDGDMAATGSSDLPAWTAATAVTARAGGLLLLRRRTSAGRDTRRPEAQRPDIQ